MHLEKKWSKKNAYVHKHVQQWVKPLWFDNYHSGFNTSYKLDLVQNIFTPQFFVLCSLTISEWLGR